jgi:hypothetical protein
VQKPLLTTIGPRPPLPLMQPAPKSAFKELRPELTPRPPSIVVTRDVLRVEDGDDLVRSRIDDEDLVADQDVVVASPLRIDHEHFRRQRIETHALRHVEMRRLQQSPFRNVVVGNPLQEGSAVSERPAYGATPRWQLRVGLRR